MSRLGYDVASVRAAEAQVIAQVGGLALMRRAAHGLSLACARLLSSCYGARVAVLVGSGNNGGDALFAGAELARRGAAVTALCLTEHPHPDGTAALRSAGGRVVSADDREAEGVVSHVDLVLDGVVGIGGRGALASRPADLLDLAMASGALIVAVDLPSGVDADTATVAGPAAWADVTVTFGALKPGLVVTPGSEHCGIVDVVDIGLGPALAEQVPVMEVLDADDVARLLPVPGASSDKYSAGVPGIVAGSSLYPGAALLATGAALHAKAGLVRYVGPAATEVVQRWPSAVVASGLPSRAGRVQAWGIGPGIGTDGAAAAALRDVLDSDVPVVIDADALTLLADDASLLGLLRLRTAATVLTPHGGEFARLAPDLEVDAGRLAAATGLAQRLGVTVLLKGAATVVASPGHTSLVNPTGTPWLANAGTGDVLTGLLAAYLAAGVEAHVAAGAAAFVHGWAGHLASEGARQPIAADQLIDALAPTYAMIRGAGA
jgi:ADP-dependent NAD(P)H-hydrate dehydratase / NAD(P)H-hydrate epimerase